ncbi:MULTISPECIES: EutN/CcmL family microcompartment protein [Enterococcaceae]|uniref:EutN/CcmL family microcompartment protein n=1 Tax=Enterococcaceae TaxID=81852 RepID=UPI000E48C781|nr:MULTISPECIES: EutN/CcmL family microcompartment protein [Enterococcaceae]MCI0130377.1 EutN/CcmL family microcompartment protein [Vagococcus sp. CY53-2]RGI32107.1 ethanolamine utilization protein EutN [Melissococcus sp. OM08-11BH]UNM89812.1 EutN/CcmL family microcompartment protein [Vagococcus sp. CY52-2]
MVTATLIDNIWATRKSDKLQGLKLMLAQINGGVKDGEIMVVCDVIGAGIGDRVIIATGTAARRMLEDDLIPVDAAVIGIIDESCESV